MKRLLAISIASASVVIGAIPVVAEVDSKIHALCLDAKDYSGCIRKKKKITPQSQYRKVVTILAALREAEKSFGKTYLGYSA